MHPDEQLALKNRNPSPESTQGQSRSIREIAVDVIAWEKFDMLCNNDGLYDEWSEACNPEDILDLIRVAKTYHELACEIREKGLLNVGGYMHRISEMARYTEKAGFGELLR